MESMEKVERQRHGCVTAWLIFLIIANSFTALTYLFLSDLIIEHSPVEMSKSYLFALGFIGILNLIFAIFLLRWKKWAFRGFLFTTIITFAINIISGQSFWQSLFGFLGIIILYGILQIKEEGVSTWNHLE